MSTLLPYQQRVVDEKNELDEKIEKLGRFIGTEGTPFINLPESERERLAAQYEVMKEYSDILEARIEDF